MNKTEKPKAAVYARVGNATKIAVYIYGDGNSCEMQQEYYLDKYNHDGTVKIVGFYTDVRAARKAERPGLKKLLAECKKGRIDEVHTKSVSRLSRNTIDAVQIIKELKDLGVAVVFEQENVNTLTSTGDMLISVLTTIAAEDTNPKRRRVVRCGKASTVENKSVSEGYRLQAEHYKATLCQDKTKAKEDTE